MSTTWFECECGFTTDSESSLEYHLGQPPHAPQTPVSDKALAWGAKVAAEMRSKHALLWNKSNWSWARRRWHNDAADERDGMMARFDMRWFSKNYAMRRGWTAALTPPQRKAVTP